MSQPYSSQRQDVAGHIRNVVGANVRRLRVQSGATQAEMSQMLRSHESYWRGVENGTKQFSLVRLVEIADCLSTSASTLLEGV